MHPHGWIKVKPLYTDGPGVNKYNHCGTWSGDFSKPGNRSTTKPSYDHSWAYIQEAVAYNRDRYTSIFLMVPFPTSRNSNQSRCLSNDAKNTALIHMGHYSAVNRMKS